MEILDTESILGDYTMIEIKRLKQGDEALLTQIPPNVFDNAVNTQLTKEFLADPRHHLIVAIDNTQIIGFASALHYIHPDKPPQLFINEVAVAPAHRRRGIAKSILAELLNVAREVGCTEAWVLTDEQNTPAMRLYSSLGGIKTNHEMFTFPVNPDHVHPTPDDSPTPNASVDFYRALSHVKSPAELLAHALKYSQPLIGFDAYIYLTTQDLPPGGVRIIASGTPDDPRVAADYVKLTGLPRLDRIPIIQSPNVALLQLGPGAGAVHLPPSMEQDELGRALAGFATALVVPAFRGGDVFGHFVMLRKSARTPTDKELDAAVHATNVYTRLIIELRVLDELKNTTERLNQELHGVVDIQRRLLPPIPDDTTAMSFAVRYSPCAQAGGDFYSVRKTRENHYALVIADVSGHGAGAAVVMSMLRAWIGVFRLGWQPLENVATGINTLWAETASLACFATAAFFEVNELTGWIRSINCGHPPALVVSPSGDIRELQHDSALPLGIVPELATPIVTDTLCPGDTLILYTDGIPEARNPRGEFFGEDRLLAAVKQIATEPNLQRAADLLMQQLDEFRAGEPQSDDQCLVLARMNPQ